MAASRILKDFNGDNKQLNEQLGVHLKAKPIVYVFNDEYIKMCDQLPKVLNRASMTHTLISAYGLLEHMRCVSPDCASDSDVSLFHSTEYIDCLRTLSSADDDEKYSQEAEEFGLTYDCPAYGGVYEHAQYIAGGTLTAARCLAAGHARIAINWGGGWHHAKRHEAAGFCYINDIVLGVLKLSETFGRVLYVDLDLHHGDGVQDAFYATAKVMTVSFHKVAPYFFPGTGFVSEVGIRRGKGHCVNVPLKDGVCDEQYCEVFNRVLEMVQRVYPAQAVVCQCGADGLAGDPTHAFNLSCAAATRCVRALTALQVPLLLLGGGGYHFANTARCWTSITAEVTGCSLASDIPEHQYFTEYGPDFQIGVCPGNRANENSAAYIEETLQTIARNLKNIEQQSKK